MTKRIKLTQEFEGKSIIPIQWALNNNDRLKKSDDNISSSNTIPGKSLCSIHSDVIYNKVHSLSVVAIPTCLINNSFTVELLQNNDSFLNIVNDRAVTNKDDVDIPQNKDVNIPSKNNNQSSLHIKVPRNKLLNQLFNSDTVKYHVSTNDKDISIPKNKDVDIPKKRCQHTSK